VFALDVDHRVAQAVTCLGGAFGAAVVGAGFFVEFFQLPMTSVSLAGWTCLMASRTYRRRVVIRRTGASDHLGCTVIPLVWWVVVSDPPRSGLSPIGTVSEVWSAACQRPA
jgi:hypothetical protein